MARSYEDVIRRHNLNDEKFPYAEAGVKIFSRIYSFSRLAAAGLLLWVLGHLIAGLIVPDGFDRWRQDPKMQFRPKQTEPDFFSLDGVSYHMTKLFRVKEGVLLPDAVSIGYRTVELFFRLLENIGKYVFFILLAYLVVQWVRYLMNLIKRQRIYERNVLFNDFTAVRLRNYILRESSVSDTLRETKAALDRKEDPSVEDNQKVKMLETAERVKVLINTRQNVDSERIMTRYKVLYELPGNGAVREKLHSFIKNVNDIGTSFFENRVSFGEMLESDDKRYFLYKAEREIKDRYSYTIDDEEIDLTEYESSFSTTVFKDYREEAKEKMELAKKWAGDSTTVVTTLLTTKNVLCTLVETIVSNTAVVYKYAMAPGSGFPNTDDIMKNLNASFQINDSDCKMDANLIVITIPLKKEYKMPLDTASLYRQMFGSAD